MTKAGLNVDHLMDGLFGTGDVASMASTQQDTAGTNDEKTAGKIVELNLDEIYDKPNHTFTVNTEAADWQDFVASIREYGIQTPILVRHNPCNLGTYECIAGHRRRAGARDAGLAAIPAIVTDADDSVANILMIITNKQRDGWSISETAHSWKTLYEELKRQSRQIVAKSAEGQMEELSGQDIRTVQRIIKLCDLIPPLLDLVDSKKMPTGVGYQLSFLSADNQGTILRLIESFGIPTPDDAQYFRKMQEAGELNAESAYIYLNTRQQKPKSFKLTEKEIRNWFPADYTGSSEDKKDLIRQLIDNYFNGES